MRPAIRNNRRGSLIVVPGFGPEIPDAPELSARYRIRPSPDHASPLASESGPAKASLRNVFVRTPDAKRRLSECLAAGNVEKVLRAPVIAIVAMDLDWWQKLPFLFPHKDMSGTYGTNPQKAAETALRNSSLQGAYLMIAARALGFDVGAMSGFDNAKVDAGFLGDTRWRSNFLCSIGHADPSRLYPRHPRFDFETVCTLI